MTLLRVATLAGFAALASLTASHGSQATPGSVLYSATGIERDGWNLQLVRDRDDEDRDRGDRDRDRRHGRHHHHHHHSGGSQEDRDER